MFVHSSLLCTFLVTHAISQAYLSFSSFFRLILDLMRDAQVARKHYDWFTSGGNKKVSG